MRYQKLLGKTQKIPANAKDLPISELLHRAGYIRPLGSGLIALLPLGLKVQERIKGLLVQMMESLEGQEVQVPLLSPGELWSRSGRRHLMGAELLTTRDRQGRELVLSPTHEESLVSLLQSSMGSLRELPLLLYQFQLKFRDEPRPAHGLLRSREFLMKDGYSFHRSFTDLNNFFPRVVAAYRRLLEGLGLELLVAEAGVGNMGGSKAYEFLVPWEQGDQKVVYCSECGYTANRKVARARKKNRSESLLPLELVSTPDCGTMEKLSWHLSRPLGHLAKTMLFQGRDHLIMAVVRGDADVSLEKLGQLLQEPILGKASAAALEARGLLSGYLSPVGLQDQSILVVVDDAVADDSNLVMGANRPEKHFLNVNFGRDYDTAYRGDIATANDNDGCPHCSPGFLREVPALELGHIFKLDETYSRSMGFLVRDEEGRSFHPFMGCYGIGVGRLLTALASAGRDERGLRWPRGLEPYQVYLMTIGNSLRVKEAADSLYETMKGRCLYDDREESPGVKFADADLLGIPLRVVLTRQLFQKGLVELKDRHSGEILLLPLEGLKEELEKRL